MLLLRRGRTAEEEKDAAGVLRYVSIDGARAPKRREARVAVNATNRAIARRKSVEEREGATVPVLAGC
jgi:hypothetical protein